MRTIAPYLSGALAATASFVASGLAGFVSLYFLVQILNKDDFGAYSFAANVVMLASLLATLGLDRTLLLRLSPLKTPAGVLAGRSLFLRSCLLATGAVTVIGLAIWLGAGRNGPALHSDLAGWWIRALLLGLLPLTLLVLARAWFQANHRVGDAAVMPGVADVARAGMIAMAFAFGLGKGGVVLAFCLSAVVPLAVLGYLARRRTIGAPADLPAAEIGRGMVFVSQRIVDVGLYLVDIIVIGLVATDAVTAEYAIAARLAAMTDLGRLALISTFTPRVRMHFHAEDTGELAHEYHRARLASFGIACVVAIGMVLFGRQLLAIFGDFSGSYAPLMVLVSGYVFTAVGGLHASYLTMTGEVRLSALIRSLGLGVAIAGLVVLTPPLGALGAAVAITAAMCAINIASMILLWRRTGFRAFGPAPMIIGLFCMVLLWLTAAGLLSAYIASISLIVAIAIFAGLERSRQTPAQLTTGKP